jgi:hypothetical protein
MNISVVTGGVIFGLLYSWDNGFLEPLELLGPSSELVSGVDYTVLNRSRSHFPRIFDW